MLQQSEGSPKGEGALARIIPPSAIAPALLYLLRPCSRLRHFKVIKIVRKKHWK